MTASARFEGALRRVARQSGMRGIAMHGIARAGIRHLAERLARTPAGHAALGEQRCAFVENGRDQVARPCTHLFVDPANIFTEQAEPKAAAAGSGVKRDANRIVVSTLALLYF